MNSKVLTNKISRGKKFTLSAKNKKVMWCYLILAPQIIGYIAFTLYPTLWAWVKAFFYDVQIPSRTHFVGLENFIKVFTTDTTYWKSWVTTFIFAIGKLPLELPLAMIAALCLTRKSIKLKGIFRAIFYLPNIVSVAIVGLMMSGMFDYFGFINAWLLKLGVIDEAISWFSNTDSAMWMLVGMSVWWSFGTNVLYFMAALNNVPNELFECAKLDGANSWTIFFKIQLPMMAPVLQTILLLSLNGALHTGEYILASTNGAPYGTTYTVMAYQAGKFVPGFADGEIINIGYGSAVCVVTSVIMMMIALAYTKVSKRLQNLY